MALVTAVVLAATAFAAPTDNISPEVQGVAKLGGRISCASGSWSGGVSKFYFSWVRDGLPIEARYTHSEYPEYILQKADEGHEVWCIATAKGEGTEVSAESWNSVCLGACHVSPPEPPVNRAKPEVSGTGEVGKTLKCSEGTWEGNPKPTLSYHWLRDEREIQGQTTSSYTVAAEDEGHKLSCKVLAVNSVGESFAISSNNITVLGHPPTPVEGQPTVVEGVGNVGETLTCNHGGWSGTAPITFSFQWYLGGEEIPNATGQTLLVQASYEGQNVSCEVTARNSVNVAKEKSAQFGIGEQTPVSTQRPTIAGKAEVGQKLSCSKGEWTGNPVKFEYTWHRMEGGLEREVGTHSSEYTVVSADQGYPLYCTVKAENSAKKVGTAKSEAFVIPEAGKVKPHNEALPSISGIAGAGHTLKCERGTWGGSEPVSFEYQWVRDADGQGEVEIKEPEGTKETYGEQVADVGHSLTCRVTARNGGGTGQASSAAFEIPGSKPTNTQAPSISPAGTASVGETLTCLQGAWEGTPAPKYTYRWFREGIDTAVTGYVYKVTKADAGYILSCAVTAINKYDEANPVEARSGGVYVPGGPPEALEAPSIAGNAQVNEEVVCEEGRWNGARLSTSFQWVLNGIPIPGATQKNLRVATAYRGQLLACRVTQRNEEGSASAESPAKRVPGVPPHNVVPPTITGVGSLGAQLTCEHGLWEGAPPPSFSYVWYRDSTPIAGATAATYTIEPADVGHLLACVVTATNVSGPVEVESENVVPVLAHKEAEGAHTATITPSTTKQTITVVHDAFESQLPNTLAGMHLKNVRKSGGASFAFTSPRAGKLEVQWYITLKAAHGKTKRITLARGVASYAQAARTTIHIALTKEGRRLLKHAKRVKLTAEATFTVSGGPTIAWSRAFTLH
ncbi:MAG TPA: hypothetical protein VHT27_12160 [Solirubrobacteraceae bacterium]|nr:hypothetical protein [Solirubrobacteraceae bacterium]